jgi:hypothetical protein
VRSAAAPVRAAVERTRGAIASADAPAQTPADARRGANPRTTAPPEAPAASRSQAQPERPQPSAAALLAQARTLRARIATSRNPARALAPLAPPPAGSLRVQIAAPASRSPDRAPPAAAAPGRTMPDAGPGPQVARAAASSGARPLPAAGAIRIFIHHVKGRSRDAALAQRLADRLRSQGFTVADIRPVDFAIGKPSVRYFFEQDHDGSERLVEALGRYFKRAPFLAPEHASDFTHFEPKPRPGNVEVWLPAVPAG